MAKHAYNGAPGPRERPLSSLAAAKASTGRGGGSWGFARRQPSTKATSGGCTAPRRGARGRPRPRRAASAVPPRALGEPEAGARGGAAAEASATLADVRATSPSGSTSSRTCSAWGCSRRATPCSRSRRRAACSSSPICCRVGRSATRRRRAARAALRDMYAGSSAWTARYGRTVRTLPRPPPPAPSLDAAPATSPRTPPRHRRRGPRQAWRALHLQGREPRRAARRPAQRGGGDRGGDGAERIFGAARRRPRAAAAAAPCVLARTTLPRGDAARGGAGGRVEPDLFGNASLAVVFGRTRTRTDEGRRRPSPAPGDGGVGSRGRDGGESVEGGERARVRWWRWRAGFGARVRAAVAAVGLSDAFHSSWLKIPLLETAFGAETPSGFWGAVYPRAPWTSCVVSDGKGGLVVHVTVPQSTAGRVGEEAGRVLRAPRGVGDEKM